MYVIRYKANKGIVVVAAVLSWPVVLSCWFGLWLDGYDDNYRRHRHHLTPNQSNQMLVFGEMRKLGYAIRNLSEPSREATNSPLT